MGTTCEANRKKVLLEAIDSVLAQAELRPEMLLVVNGSRFDAELLRLLSSNDRLQIVQVAEPNFPGAIREGVFRARAEFFSFLDDDDLFLPGAVASRVQPMIADSTIDFVATNGWLECAGGENTLAFPQADEIRSRPLASFLQANWLASCGGMFRAARCGVDFFPREARYCNQEWTLLAFDLLVSGRRPCFLDVPTFFKRDTPESLYKTRKEEYCLAELEAAQHMFEAAPGSVKGLARRKLVDALHEVSDFYREQGRGASAWKYHLKTLSRGGLRHLFYTRKLISLGKGQPRAVSSKKQHS